MMNYPIFNYCREGKYNDVKRLLKQNVAHVNAKEKNGLTLLHIACQTRYPNRMKMIQLLLGHGADINVRTDRGWTALHFASRDFNDVDLVTLLLDKGADINAKSFLGCTALHVACRYSNGYDVVRLLLDRGASIHTKNSNGLTALEVATEAGKKQMEIGDMLTQAEADSKRINKFYTNLLRDDNSNDFDSKINELIPHIQNVYDAKMMYTYLSISEKISKIITIEDRKKYTLQMLEQMAQTTTSDTTGISIYKLTLEKALDDKLIDRRTFHELDQTAEEKRMSNAQFVRDIRHQFQDLSTRLKFVEGKVQLLENKVDFLDNKVDYLDNRVDSLNDAVSRICDSVNTIKHAFRKNMKVRAVTGCIGAVLNAVSFGVAGSALEGAASSVLSSIVDFSDISHIKEIINQADDAETKEALEMGEAMLMAMETEAQRNFEKVLLQEMEKLGTDQSPVIHATIVAAAISYENNIVNGTDLPTDVALEASPVNLMDTTSKKSPKERMEALADAIGLEFEEDLSPIEKLSLLEENCAVEDSAGNLVERIESLEKLVLK